MPYPFQTGDIPTANDFNNIATSAAAAAAAAAAPAAIAAANAQITPNVTIATTQAAAALGSQNAASASNTNAQIALAGTTSAAAQAATARDQTLAALNTAMAPVSSLPAISQSIHFGAIVKTFLYDTSKDSDGGAWRKRCTDKSWYTEPISGGTWRQQQSNLAAAWAITGAVAGDFYQNTTDGLFYQIGGTIGAQTQAQVYRGNAREFPEQVAIIAEAGRVIIYDLTQAGCPMWMVFQGTIAASWSVTNILWGQLTSVFCVNGAILVGSANPAGGGCTKVSFIADAAMRYSSAAGGGLYSGNIAARNNSLLFQGGATNVIINPISNDVAAVVLDGAPVDPATGLPIPTIAVATNGGVSVIRSDGTVVNSSPTGNTLSCSIVNNMLFLSSQYGITNVARFKDLNNIAASWTPTDLAAAPFAGGGGVSDVTTVASRGGSSSIATVHAAGGFSARKINLANQALSMLAYINNTYNSGWQVGDARLTTLSDTVAETITASGELVTNGTNPTTTTGWTGINATLSVAGSTFQLTGTASNGYELCNITTVIGKTYLLSATVNVGTTNNAGVGVLPGTNVITTSSASPAVIQLSFVATATTSQIYIQVNNAGTAIFNNISCKLAVPDRSWQNNGMVLNGTLTKAPVALGAGLVAYSGFSATNYLEQPYNSNLDFGTGDFCVMGWVNIGAGGDAPIFFRALDYSTSSPINGINIWVYGGNTLKTKINGIEIDSTANLISGAYNFFAAVRLSGVVYIYINGILSASGANAGSLTLVGAIADIGKGFYASAGQVLSLMRAGATAPSADQIAYIYRTELALFQPNAQCTIDGTSAAVTALAYDDTSSILQVGSSWGRSGFKDLLRVDSEVSTVGLITSLAMSQGGVLQGGSASGKYYQPAMLLRDEIRRRDEAQKALGKVPVFFDFDAIAAQTAFVLPKGCTTKAVYSAGGLKRLGATKDYLTSYDGFQESVNFGTSPGAAAWVSIMAIRSN